MSETPPSLVDSVLVEGLDDWVDAATVYSCALDIEPLSSADRRAIALGAITEVLARGRMRAGSVGREGFTPWQGTCGEWIERITGTWLREWDLKPPTPGAVVWLDLTPEGHAVALAAWERDPQAFQGEPS